MNARANAGLVLAIARVLYVNGQVTGQAINASRRLGLALGLRTELLPRWGLIQLKVEGWDDRLIVAEADPAGVDMYRVAAAMRAIEDIEGGRLSPESAVPLAEAISRAPAWPAWLFVLAAAAGAVALAVIYGVDHPVPAVLIFLSAGAGAIVRRCLASRFASVIVQVSCAALLAGIVGALAVRYQLGSSLRLVAICPCMVLVPGPHLLNSAADLLAGRVHLGAARLVFASLLIVAIVTGLLLGLAMLGVSLPDDPAGRLVPLWQDALAAGVAVMAYSGFFSSPTSTLPWSVAVGVLAHAFRWAALAVFGVSVAIGTLGASLLVGLILSPVARRLHMPFAAMGFSSVVSMMPGSYLFTMASGLVQISGDSGATMKLLNSTISSGMSALVIVMAMSLGLVIPKALADHFHERNPDVASTIKSPEHP